MQKDFFKGQNSLMRVVFFLFSYLLISSPVSAQLNVNLADGTSLELLGLGVHQELRNDIYVGALYAPQGVKNAELLNDEQIPKRMSIRLLSAYSQRKMARHWKERLALNNSRDVWQPFTREIINFSRLFKRKFEAGDELNIDFIPGQGTLIYLNGTLFETIKKPGFTSLLLNVWLGNTPPTKAFKNNIRGELSADLKSNLTDRYNALQPVAGRFDDDLAVKADETRVADSTKSAGPSASADSVKPKASPSGKIASNKPAKKQVNKQKIAVARDTVKNDLKAKSEKIAAKSASQPADSAQSKKSSNSKTLAKTEKPQVKSSPTSLAKIDIASTKPDIKIETELFQKEPIEEDLFDADLISGSYTRDLIDSIRQYQKYPKKALINQEQGDVTVTVNIDAHGEIIDIKLVEKSGSRILDKAVIRMVRKAAPFEAIPKELKLETFEFDLPISFQL